MARCSSYLCLDKKEKPSNATARSHEKINGPYTMVMFEEQLVLIGAKLQVY